MGTHYDVLVVGSGFGGSVTALRLTEKGYRVGVLEAGARFEDADFSAETTNLAKAQILTQASTAMLAQANQSQQGVLSLLR